MWARIADCIKEAAREVLEVYLLKQYRDKKNDLHIVFIDLEKVR